MRNIYKRFTYMMCLPSFAFSLFAISCSKPHGGTKSSPTTGTKSSPTTGTKSSPTTDTKSSRTIGTKSSGITKNTSQYDDWVTKKARKEVAHSIVAKKPHLKKKLEEEGVDKFWEFLERENAKEREQELKNWVRLSRALDKLSDSDRKEFFNMWKGDTLILKDEEEEFLRSKGALKD